MISSYTDLKHKPNKKHTLDEVLKSLQDLIRNDVIQSEGGHAAFAGPRSAAGDGNIDDILHSLKDLIADELSESTDLLKESVVQSIGAQNSFHTATPSGHETDLSFDDSIEIDWGEIDSQNLDTTKSENHKSSQTTPSNEPERKYRIPPEGLQVSFGFDRDEMPVERDVLEDILAQDLSIELDDERTSPAPASDETSLDRGPELTKNEALQTLESIAGDLSLQPIIEEIELTAPDLGTDDEELIIADELSLEGLEDTLTPSSSPKITQKEKPIVEPEMGLVDEGMEFEAQPVSTKAARGEIKKKPRNRGKKRARQKKKISNKAHLVVDLSADDAIHEELPKTGSLEIHDSGADRSSAMLNKEIAAAINQATETGAIPSPRDLAIKVVARLNIELRKAGKKTLEPLTIDRMQHILVDYLKTKSAY